jgi:hypothetical protein
MPHLVSPSSTSLLFLLRQSRRLVIVQFLPHDAKQDRALRVAGDQYAVVKVTLLRQKASGLSRTSLA